MITQAPTYRWTVEEWRKLGPAGIFGEDDRVELLNGEIVLMSPIGYRHSLCLNKLARFFERRSRDRYMVGPQNPVVLDAHSEPQPDLQLIDPAWETHATDNPHPHEIFLIIEVADSSLPYDRNDKAQAYARRGIAEFWIANLQDRVMEVHRQPGSGYAIREVFRREQSVSPLAFPDIVLPVGEVID